MTPTDQNTDNDLRKGAIEEDNPHDKPMTSLAGQLGHRDQDPLIKSSDSDFPEPGENPEHMGQFKERNRKDQDTRLVCGTCETERRGAGAKSEPPPQPQPQADGSSNPEGQTQSQEPGHSQKQNQGGKKDDDLAA